MTSQHPIKRPLIAVALALALPTTTLIGGCSTNETSVDAPASEPAATESTDAATTPEASEAAPVPDAVPESAYVTAEQAKALVDSAAHVMDVRNRYDFSNGHIMSARNLATGKALEINAGHYESTDAFLVVAADDEKGGSAWMTLVGTGIPAENVSILQGGMEAWLAAGYPYETSEVAGC